MKVLVTGGSGFLGKALQKVRPDWIYLSSKDCDLRSKRWTFKKFGEIKPDAIIHLAGRVGGIKENAAKQAEFYYDNIAMNTNVIHCAQVLGINRVLSSLTTCSFPDVVDKYPFTEKDILKGSPAETNLSYGFAKRGLYIMSNAYRKQYGLNYSTFCPSNIYGPEDNFDLESSHFVPAMIRKFAEVEAGDKMVFWGTGSPLRQQLYVDDLAEIIPLLLEKHNSDVPIIVAPDENLSIVEMINICDILTGKDPHVSFNGELDGQYRKDGSNAELKKLIGDYQFTPFRRGLLKTIKWYKENK